MCVFPAGLFSPGTSHRATTSSAATRCTARAPGEVVYRRELRPVTTTGAEIMDDVFAEASHS